MQIFGGKTFFKMAMLAAAGMGLSGCVYDLGLGYASDGYYDDYYDCDPYGGYDRYYRCDYGHGFYNIGFGGGWYDNHWYPGYGFSLFDNHGRRHPMRDHHRRYWGEKRHHWYRENHRRHEDGGRHRGRRGSGYTGDATPGAIGWPERGRMRDGDDNDNGDGRRDRNRGWQGGQGNGVNAIPTPPPEAARGEANRSGRGDAMRRSGQDRSGWRGNDGANATPVPRPDRPAAGRGDGGGRAYRAPPQSAPEARGQSVAPRVMPAPCPHRAKSETLKPKT